jgi:DNA integrity scanning protein DisA with diadenylate cyclase activity
MLAIEAARPSDRPGSYQEAHRMVTQINEHIFPDVPELSLAMEVDAMEIDKVVGDFNIDEIDEILVRIYRENRRNELEEDLEVLSTMLPSILDG